MMTCVAYMLFSRPNRRWAVPTVAALWLLAVAGGWCWMTTYEFKAGNAGITSSFPESVTRLLSDRTNTLFVSLHPECTCSVATLEELARISEECSGQLKIVAVFSEYSSLPEKVEESSLWKRAVAIPGLAALVDHDGSLRAGLGSLTSGDCLLADPAGVVLYHGGITSSRGHAGASAGGDAIISLARGNGSHLKTAPVFGCGLDGKDAG